MMVAKPVRRRVVVAVAVAVLFFLSAATFGTLWILERGDHGSAASELTDLRTQADAVKEKLARAEAKQKDLDSKKSNAATERVQAQEAAFKYGFCADATKALLGVDPRNEQEWNKAFDSVDYSCGV